MTLDNIIIKGMEDKQKRTIFAISILVLIVGSILMTSVLLTGLFSFAYGLFLGYRVGRNV